MRKNVIVFFGGISCENEISIITGTMAANLIDSERYAVYPVYISQSGTMYTGELLRDTAFFRGADLDKRCPRAIVSGGKLYELRGKKLREVCVVDCALNCCHGMNGEDGAVAGLLRLNRIPDASPDMAASAVFMDKGMTKLVAKALNIPTPEFFRISEAEYKKRGAMAIRCIEERLGYPVIVKPARLGSSIGVAVAEDRSGLAFAIEAGFAYDTLLIAEKYLADRREINCAAYGAGGEIVVSACEEPKTDHKFLTFGDKYIGEGKQHASDFPAKISKESAECIRGYTKLLYRRMNMRGIVRADFLMSGGEVYFNEMNTVPGSLAWYLFCDKLVDFRQVLTVLIEQGIAEGRALGEKKLLQNSGVLGGFRSSQGKARRG